MHGMKGKKNVSGVQSILRAVAHRMTCDGSPVDRGLREHVMRYLDREAVDKSLIATELYSSQTSSNITSHGAA